MEVQYLAAFGKQIWVGVYIIPGKVVVRSLPTHSKLGIALALVTEGYSGPNLFIKFRFRRDSTFMKFKSIIARITLCAVLVALSGCKKQEDAAVPATPTASPAPASGAANDLDATKSAAMQVADQATAQATNQVNAADQQAQSLIDRAKAYVADQKYQDALSSLNQLAATQLTADQQKTVDGLKAQIQSALAKVTGAAPASALGGALGGQK